MMKIIYFLLIIFLFIIPFAFADIGPKPTISSEVYYNGEKIGFGIELHCYKEKQEYRNEVSLPDPELEKIYELVKEKDSSRECYWQIPKWFDHPNEVRFAIYVKNLDKAFISNVVEVASFNSNYRIDVNSNGEVKVAETEESILKEKNRVLNISNNERVSFMWALFFTVIIELIIALIFLAIAKISFKVLIVVLFANIISLPAVWFVFPHLGLRLFTVAVFEIFAFGFESLFIGLTCRKLISWKNTFILCFIMNSLSFLIGRIAVKVIALTSTIF